MRGSMKFVTELEAEAERMRYPRGGVGGQGGRRGFVRRVAIARPTTLRTVEFPASWQIPAFANAAEARGGVLAARSVVRGVKRRAWLAVETFGERRRQL